MASIRERIDNDGNTSYQAQVRIHGYPPRSKTFLRKTDAKKWAVQTETEIRTGMTIRTNSASQHTVREMLDRYKDTVLIDKAGGGKDHKTHIAFWIEQLGHYALSEVSTDLVTRSIDKLKKKKTRLGTPPAPATVLRYMMALSHAFTVARKRSASDDVDENTMITKVLSEGYAVRCASLDRKTHGQYKKGQRSVREVQLHFRKSTNNAFVQ